MKLENAVKLVDKVLRMEHSNLDSGATSFSDRPDLVYRGQEGPVAVVVKTATAPRIQEVLGALTRGFIVIRDMVGSTSASKAVVVVTPRLGSSEVFEMPLLPPI